MRVDGADVMADTRRVEVDFGDHRLAITVPAAAVVAEFQDPPVLGDPEAAVRKALAAPVEGPALRELARSGMRVVIGFDNPTRPGLPAQTILPLVVEELVAAGVAESHITLICANANHRKWTPAELATHVGRPLFDRFAPYGRLLNHDASDPAELSFLGTTANGGWAEHNRRAVEADLLVYQGNISPTYWGGYTGMGVVVGLGSARSIRSHHGYQVMAHPESCTGDHRTSRYRQLKAEIHDYIEKATGRRVFYIDAVGGVGGRLAGVFAGYAPRVDEAACELADTFSRRSVPQADVLIVGLPGRLPYEDPDNTLVAGVAALVPPRVWLGHELLREGAVVIALSPSAGRIDPVKYPSYQPVIDLYARHHDIAELADHEEDFAHRPDLIHQYRHGFGYHPLHAFWLFYQSHYTLGRAGRVVMAGTRNPGAFRDLGITPVRDFDAAWKVATTLVGARPTVVVAPSYYSRRLFKFEVEG